jgi:hypothetical protein
MMVEPECQPGPETTSVPAPDLLRLPEPDMPPENVNGWLLSSVTLERKLSGLSKVTPGWLAVIAALLPGRAAKPRVAPPNE